MKKLALTLILAMATSLSFSQTDSTATQQLAVKQDTVLHRITKTDGGKLIGIILKQDSREILLLTKDKREIYIPQHIIEKIEELSTSDFNNKGVFVGEDKFATRYFLTTNGLPIKKGDHYVQWNLFGPDFQFGVGKNLGIGVMTTWLGIPLIASIKKSWQLGDKTQFALGALVGTASWAAPDVGGFLPFGTISIGDRKKNLAFSGGYGAVWSEGSIDGRGLSSIAGMVKISNKISLILDSFILLPGKTTTSTSEILVENQTTGIYEPRTVTEENRKRGFALIIPGIRWHKTENTAVQFGFTGIMADGEVLPAPIPTVQWYRTL